MSFLLFYRIKVCYSGSKPPTAVSNGFVYRHHGYFTTGALRTTWQRQQQKSSWRTGVKPEHLTEERHIAIDSIGLTVVGQGVRVVAEPVGTEHFKRDFLHNAVNSKPAVFLSVWSRGTMSRRAFRSCVYLRVLAYHNFYVQSSFY